MVVIGVDAGRFPGGLAGGRRDADVVSTFFHRGAELAQLDRHGANAVGFLDAPAGDIAQRGHAVGIQRHGAQRHGRIGNMVAIEVDGLQRPAATADLQPVGAAFDLCAHGLGGLDEADIALDRVLAYTQNADAPGLRRVVGIGVIGGAGGNRAQRDEIAGRRGVGLHMDGARRLIVAACGDHKALPAVVFHGDAEARQQLQRDVDIGLGDQLAHHLDADVAFLGQQGQGHQQRGQELTGDIAAHLDGFAAQLAEVGLADFQGRKAFILQIVDLAAQLAQRIDQVADGAFIHAGNACHLEVAAQHRQRCGQRAHGRAGIAQEQRRLGAGWQLAADAGDVNGLVGCDGIRGDATAQLLESGQHDAGVVRVQQVVNGGGALAQRRQQQHAIGDAFGAGQADATVGGVQCGQVQKFGGEHKTLVTPCAAWLLRHQGCAVASALCLWRLGE